MKLDGSIIKKVMVFFSGRKEDSDIFVHISAVKDSDVKRLEKGQIVEYDIQEQDNGKSAAANIKILQEAPNDANDDAKESQDSKKTIYFLQ